MIATIRAGNFQDTEELLRQIRSGVNLSQLAAHVRNALRTDKDKQSVFNSIEFTIDHGSELPSPTQILDDMQNYNTADMLNDSASQGSHGSR